MCVHRCICVCTCECILCVCICIECAYVYTRVHLCSMHVCEYSVHLCVLCAYAVCPCVCTCACMCGVPMCLHVCIRVFCAHMCVFCSVPVCLRVCVHVCVLCTCVCAHTKPCSNRRQPHRKVQMDDRPQLNLLPTGCSREESSRVSLCKSDQLLDILHVGAKDLPCKHRTGRVKCP